MLGKNLNTEEIQFLKEMKDRLLTQDNCYTTDPVYVVQEKYKQSVPDYRGEFVEYIETMSGDNCSYDSYEEMVEAFLESGYDKEEQINDSDYFENSYNIDWRNINYHFTREGAEWFIKRKKHDYNELRIYVDSLYHCYEMKMLRDILLKLEF